MLPHIHGEITPKLTIQIITTTLSTNRAYTQKSTLC
jgi:hypothetical protein